MLCIRCAHVGPDGAYCVHCGAKQTIKRSRRRRANGQGSVYKRGKTYQAIVTYYEAGERKTHSKSGFETKKAAYDHIPILIEEIKSGYGVRNNTTLSSIYTAWSGSALLRLSSSKQTAYRIAWTRIQAIHNIDIRMLVIDDLQRIVNEQARTYYTAKDVKNLLSHLYDRACAEQIVNTNLARFIELPELADKEAEPYREEEVTRMWEAYKAGDLFAGFPLIMIYTGMMPGELLGCKKNMIDLENQTIIGAGLKTKTRRDKPVLLPDIIVPVIREICASHPYTSVVGLNKDKFYEQYHALAKRLGIRDLAPYSCRHTTATALSVGDVVAPSVITKVMRQKNMAITERYKHADDQVRLDALNKLIISPITARPEISIKKEDEKMQEGVPPSDTND